MDNGLVVKVISLVAFERIEVPNKFLNASTLTIMAFKNTLEIIMVIVILPFMVRVREIIPTYHVVKGKM